MTGRYLPWALALAGATVIAVLAAPDLMRSGLWSMRISHAAVIAAGLALLGAAYWARAGAAGRLTSRDAPLVILSVLVLVALPLPVLLLAKQSELTRQVTVLNDRLDRLQSGVAALTGRPGRISLGCGPADPMRKPTVAWREVVSGLDSPVGLTHAGDGSGRIFVIEKAGTIRIVERGQLLAQPFLDIREAVRSEALTDVSWEEGLLGLAFEPGYGESGRFFVAYSARPDGRTVVAEHRVSAHDPSRAESVPARVVLEFEQLGGNHNSGHLAFGPDGFLYLGVGDGGYVGEHGDDPNQEAQRLDRIYGKILRIDVLGGDPYAIPEDNPFIDEPGARPEIFARGFRNPWRFSFDDCDGTLFMGDVGRTGWEEINLVEAGRNYGWPLMEGPECFWRHRGCQIEGLTLPIFAYPHRYRDPLGGGSAIGGHVYRGSLFPQLYGYYFFADFTSGQLFSLAHNPGSAGHWIVGELARLGFTISSFGEDEDSELYLVDYTGAIHQLTGAN